MIQIKKNVYLNIKLKYKTNISAFVLTDIKRYIKCSKLKIVS